MKTLYAGGRPQLPNPTITTSTGNIQGNSTVYYFWLKAKNRVGYNLPSDSTSITISNDASVTISASNFALMPYEDWREVVVYVGTSNEFTNSRALYKYKVYQDDQVTYNTPADVTITEDEVFRLEQIITDESLLPSAPVDGLRVYITSKSAVYEFRLNDTTNPNGLNVLNSSNGRWLITESLVDTGENYNLELNQVTTLEPAPLDNFSASIVPIRYYILNDTAAAISGNLNLNVYSSSDIRIGFNFQVIGYLNFSNYSLDTTSINYQNPTPYEDNLALSKPLPVNSAVVIDVYPFIESPVLPEGTYITVYPKISSYETVGVPQYYETPVEDLSALEAILEENIIDGQVRYVKSKRGFYVYDSSSEAVTNGNDIVAPSTSPTQGRWLGSSSAVASQSIGLTQLQQEVIDTLEDDTKVTTVNLLNSLPYTIDLDTGFDYFIINCPTDDGITVLIDVSATLENDSTLSCVVELRQNTAAIGFNNTITFPGGNAPALSGNGKTDMIVLSLVKDAQGNVRKRGLLSRNDIG